MSRTVKEHITTLLEKNMREDGRGLLEFRKPIKLETGISPRTAEGSAKVTIGNTEVLAGIKLEIGEPFPDNPDEGTIIVGAELLPLSNPEFESGPPSIDAIELARVVDRGIRESSMLDFKKLCVTPGEKVWIVFIDVYPLNDDGNLFDAATLAAVAAILDARFPEYDQKNNKMNFEKRTDKKLPIQKIPVSTTVIKIKDKLLIDPTTNEWSNLDSRLTVTFSDDKTICALQKGGEAPLALEEIEKMIDIAAEKTKMLRTTLNLK